MSLSIEQIARVAHEANRALQAIQALPGLPVSAAWEDSPEEHRLSVVDGVFRTVGGATPEELHENWCTFKRARGWVHGQVKDEAGRTHPCLVPYSQLPRSQRLKDDLFAAIAGALVDDRGLQPSEPLPDP